MQMSVELIGTNLITINFLENMFSSALRCDSRWREIMSSPGNFSSLDTSSSMYWQKEKRWTLLWFCLLNFSVVCLQGGAVNLNKNYIYFFSWQKSNEKKFEEWACYYAVCFHYFFLISSARFCLRHAQNSTRDFLVKSFVRNCFELIQCFHYQFDSPFSLLHPYSIERVFFSFFLSSA